MLAVQPIAMPPPSVNGSNSEAPARKPPLLPSHIAWPLFVVLLLLMSIGAALFTAYIANADGGVQVVDSEYAPGRER